MLPVRQSGRELSLLNILEEIKNEISQQRRLRNGRCGYNGKHSGSMDMSKKLRKGVAHADVDIPATLAEAITRQSVEGENIKINIKKENIKLKRYRNKERSAILFVVDASRSQGAKERLAFAKGAVMAMLEKAYCDRSRVGMILFGDRKAQRILPMTKSIDFAAEKLKGLKAKGNTPLAMGLRMAVKLQETDQIKYPEDFHIIVLLTDGKTNYDQLEGSPMSWAMKASEEVKKKRISLLVVDTENSMFSMGLAKKLAETADGKYVKL